MFFFGRWPFSPAKRLGQRRDPLGVECPFGCSSWRSPWDRILQFFRLRRIWRCCTWKKLFLLISQSSFGVMKSRTTKAIRTTFELASPRVKIQTPFQVRPMRQSLSLCPKEPPGMRKRCSFQATWGGFWLIPRPEKEAKRPSNSDPFCAFQKPFKICLPQECPSRRLRVLKSHQK